MIKKNDIDNFNSYQCHLILGKAGKRFIILFCQEAIYVPAEKSL